MIMIMNKLMIINNNINNKYNEKTHIMNRYMVFKKFSQTWSKNL